MTKEASSTSTTTAWGDSLRLESTPRTSVSPFYKSICNVFCGVDFGKLGSQSFLVKIELQPDHTRKVVQATPVRAVHFILKSVWFEQIRDGSKNVEYRPVTTRWKAILSKNPNIAIFSLGYTSRGRICRVAQTHCTVRNSPP